MSWFPRVLESLKSPGISFLFFKGLEKSLNFLFGVKVLEKQSSRPGVIPPGIGIKSSIPIPIPELELELELSFSHIDGIGIGIELLIAQFHFNSTPIPPQFHLSSISIPNQILSNFFNNSTSIHNFYIFTSTQFLFIINKCQYDSQDQLKIFSYVNCKVLGIQDYES